MRFTTGGSVRNASTTMGTLHLGQVRASASNTRLSRPAHAMRRGRREPVPVLGGLPGLAGCAAGCSWDAGSLDAVPGAKGGAGNRGRYADLFAVRTRQLLSMRLPVTKLNSLSPTRKLYRNPAIYARELHDEMVRDNLSRKQLAQRHGVSSDRITQILLTLKLPEDILEEVIARGDCWERQVVTERQLRGWRLRG